MNERNVRRLFGCILIALGIALLLWVVVSKNIATKRARVAPEVFVRKFLIPTGPAGQEEAVGQPVYTNPDGSPKLAARIEDRVITLEEFEMRAEKELKYRTGDKEELRAEFLDQMIDKKALAILAVRAGFDATEEELELSMARAREKYETEQAFEEFCSSVATTPEGMRGRVREDIAIQKYRAAVSEEVEVTAEEIEAEYERRKATGSLEAPASVDMMFIFVRPRAGDKAVWQTAEAKVGLVKPEGDDEAAWQAAKEAWQAARRKVGFVRPEADDEEAWQAAREAWQKLKGDTDDAAWQAVREAWREAKEEVDVAAWQEAREKIDAAHERLLAGEDFETVVMDVSDDIPKFLNRGLYHRRPLGSMPPAVNERMTNLPIGEISEPFKSVAGWHIIKVTGRYEAGTIPLEELAPKIDGRFRAHRTQQLLRKRIKEARATMNVEEFVHFDIKAKEEPSEASPGKEE